MKKISLFTIVASSVCFAACVPETTPETTWYADTDGDLYGDPNSSVTGDRPDSTWVSDGSDCDDTAAAINPGATEVNTDLVDQNCDGALSEAPFIVGDYGPAGGIVFQTDGVNGLEAAPEDQGSTAEWGCYDTFVGVLNTADGAKNTASIVAAGCESGNPPAPGGNPIAAELADAYSLNGYDDWYLPANDEFASLCAEKDTVGGFVTSYFYWGSTELGNSSNSWAYGYNFDLCQTGLDFKDGAFFPISGVRAIRAFPRRWYVDGDSDGHGDENDAGMVSSSQPAGYADNNFDCDDTAAAINLEANEVNTDLIDQNCDGFISEPPFSVGDYGPAGGRVFHTFSESNGLEAAPVDQGSGTAEWGCRGVTITGANATNISVSSGRNNTNNIESKCGDANTAAKLANDYSVNGYDDWFLPSKDQLNAMYTELHVNGLGDFVSSRYWSSSQFDAEDAWGHGFFNNNQVNSHKDVTNRVRAVREFNL